MFADGPGDKGSISDRVIPKTQKMVLDTSLLERITVFFWGGVMLLISGIKSDFFIGLVIECSPMARKTGVQYQIESYQRLKKWYLIPPCLTQHYKVRIKGKMEQSWERSSALFYTSM